MTSFPGKYVVALAVIAVGGCGKNEKVVGPAVDVLAQDTTLALAPVSADQYTGPQDPASILSAPNAAPTSSVATAGYRPAPSRRASVSRITQNVSSRLKHQVGAHRASRVARRSSVSIDATQVAVARRNQSRKALPPGNESAPLRNESAPHGAQDSPSRQAVIASGSLVSFATAPRICANSTNVGDRFETSLIEPLAATNGTSIPKGATAVARVSSVTRKGGIPEDAGIGLQIESISFNGRTYPVNSDVTYPQLDKIRPGSRASAASKVAAGSVLGGALGQVVGRNARSTVIGALGGAAAGAIVAHQTTTFKQCVPSGGRMTAHLTEPLIIEAST